MDTQQKEKERKRKQKKKVSLSLLIFLKILQLDLPWFEQFFDEQLLPPHHRHHRTVGWSRCSAMSRWTHVSRHLRCLAFLPF